MRRTCAVTVAARKAYLRNYTHRSERETVIAKVEWRMEAVVAVAAERRGGGAEGRRLGGAVAHEKRRRRRMSGACEAWARRRSLTSVYPPSQRYMR